MRELLIVGDDSSGGNQRKTLTRGGFGGKMKVRQNEGRFRDVA